MFKIVKSVSFTWPVKVKLPADGGVFEEHTFDVTFRRLDRTAVEKLQADLLEKDKGDTAAAVRSVVLDWSGVENDAGAVPFSDRALNDLLSINRVAPAIMAAFFESCFGVADRKN